MATTGADALGLGRHRRQVETLVAPAGDEHDVVEARDRRRAACGVVALESLNQATPPASPTSSMRCGGPTNEASAAATDVTSASPVSSTSAAAARPLVTSWGRLRRIDATAAISPCGDEQRPVLDAVVGAGRGERDVAARRAGEVAHHLGVVGETDGDVVGALVGEDLALGGGVGRQRAVPVEVVGGQVEPRRASAAEVLGPRQAEARALDDEGVDVEVDGA